jgi:hypothetical protein
VRRWWRGVLAGAAAVAAPGAVAAPLDAQAAALPPVLVAIEITAPGAPTAIAPARTTLGGLFLEALQGAGFAHVATGTAAQVREEGRRTADFSSCRSDAPVVAGVTGCIRIEVVITYTVTGGRQEASASVTAFAVETNATLHATKGRAGPYARDVPADRIIVRAVESGISEFVESLARQD